jgi:SARP family transcriptional regulator, regulator of embCAB operon
VKIGVLGPLAVSEGCCLAVPSAPKPRQVLALLVLQANRIVPVSALKKELWDDEPPPSALTTLQTYILHLRKVLGEVSGRSVRQVSSDLLVTAPGGYIFRTRSSDEIDIETFESLAREGRAAMTARRYEQAACQLRRALQLWRGPALVDVRLGRLLEVYASRLEESLLNVTELRIDADLHMGQHHGVLTELAALTTEHQFNESLHAQYMLALHRSGRRSQALNVYSGLRERMIDDLGLDPSPMLQSLQCAILEASPSLDEPASPNGALLVGRRAG